jgi:triacylglycerol lipase
VNVILVHGFLNRGTILSDLARHLNRAGHVCHVPSLKPCDARTGIPVLAEQLRRFVQDRLSDEERFVVVGFSMGAIISRYYLQELDGHRRCDGYFSIAGPHSGTVSAFLYPSKGVYQMRPQSTFLQTLDRSADRLKEIPVVCYWSPFDVMIRPLASARWHRAEHVSVPALIHSLLVFDRRLREDLLRRLEAIEAQRAIRHTNGSMMGQGLRTSRLRT